MPKTSWQDIINALHVAINNLPCAEWELVRLRQAAKDVLESYSDMYNAIGHFGEIFCNDIVSWEIKALPDRVGDAFTKLLDAGKYTYTINNITSEAR